MIRPDNANAVRDVARHAHYPSVQHCETVRCILRYLRDTKTLGIAFDKGRGLKLVAYSDSDYVRGERDKRHVSGGVIRYGDAAISWYYSRMQRCITLSSNEAEYVAFGDILEEAVFV